MSSTTRISLGAACSIALLACSQLIPAVALADELGPADEVAQTDTDLRNITYRARVDGLARGALITYKAQDNRLQTADPAMFPGRTFEANTVLPATDQAKIHLSIDPPYTANLHCEILVDGGVVAHADEFIAPRLRRPTNDPDYGVLTCQAPVSQHVGIQPADAAPSPGIQPAANQPAG